MNASDASDTASACWGHTHRATRVGEKASAQRSGEMRGTTADENEVQRHIAEEGERSEMSEVERATMTGACVSAPGRLDAASTHVSDCLAFTQLVYSLSVDNHH